MNAVNIFNIELVCISYIETKHCDNGVLSYITWLNKPNRRVFFFLILVTRYIAKTKSMNMFSLPCKLSSWSYLKLIDKSHVLKNLLIKLIKFLCSKLIGIWFTRKCYLFIYFLVWTIQRIETSVCWCYIHQVWWGWDTREARKATFKQHFGRSL